MARIDRKHCIAALMEWSLATGALVLAAIPAMAGCNSGNVGSTNLLTSASCQASAAGAGAIAVGDDADAPAGNSTAVGSSAHARGSNATALGRGSGPGAAVDGALNLGAFSGNNGTGVYSTAVGNGAGANSASIASGAWSVAVGGGDGTLLHPSSGPDVNLIGAVASGFISTAVGTASQASGGGGSAFGLYSRAIGTDSSAYGEFSTASGSRSVSIGLFSNASGVNSAALGQSSNAGGANNNAGATALGSGAQAGIGAAGQSNATAVGAAAKANADGSSAFGVLSSASGPSSLALGNNANASTPQAVAIGYNSIANVANTVSVGRAGSERRIVNLANAVNPTDAVNLRQVQALIAAAPRAPFATMSSSHVVATRNANGRVDAPAGRAGSAAPSATQSSSGGTAGAQGPGVAHGRTAAATAMSCETSAAKVRTALNDHSTSSASFTPIAETGVSFQQGGTSSGCVNLSFSAESLAPGATLMEVRAVLNGDIEALPGRVYFAQGDDVLRAHAFNFLFPNVPPGPHTVEVHFRSIGEPGTVRVGMRTTVVQHVR